MSPLTIYALQEMGNATQNDWAATYQEALEDRLHCLYSFQEVMERPIYLRIFQTGRLVRLIQDMKRQQVFLADCRKKLDWNRVSASDLYRVCFQLEQLERNLIASLNLSTVLTLHA
ncbi:hypothetical protein [Spirosoma sp. 48-14]|uniref:hypothetical protein n=1 Tax=Spirosoma sp. 48-14 TaxID=1895854 RepID=UPI00096984E3|nr:hypothetical protein [Spirosoma sp. 48-14]OJW76328.1 MAG: hypothetical protein BGO59_22680 [Spirosoma sp. 48-14]